MHKSLRVLVIERDPGLRGVLESALRGLGFQVLGRLAEGEINELPVDCILLDLARPDEAGLEFLHRLRRQGAQVPVIGLSSEPPGTPGCPETAKRLVEQAWSGLAQQALN